MSYKSLKEREYGGTEKSKKRNITALTIDILSVDGAFAAVTRDIWPPSWSGDRELESSMN